MQSLDSASSSLQSLSVQRLLAPLSIHQFFNELDALEIHELRVLLLPSVKRHGHLPGPRKDFRIFDNGFVSDPVRTRSCIALDNMQLITVKISGTIEPRLVIESLYINHESFAFPM